MTLGYGPNTLAFRAAAAGRPRGRRRTYECQDRRNGGLRGRCGRSRRVGPRRARPGAFPGQNGRIAFTSIRADSPLRDDSIGIDTITVDGSGQTRLVAGDNPAFSADGSKIAFERAPANREREIYTMNADGSGVRRLTNNAVADYDPAFSPDGSKIAFASFRGRAATATYTP